MQQHSLTAVLLAAIVLGAGTPCGASEVSYVETFDAAPFRSVSTTDHAQFADWPNGDLSTVRDNGVLRTWGTFAAHRPANPIASFKSIVMNRCGEIRTGDELEIRTDILRLAGAGACAALGWQDEGLPEIGYVLLKSADAIALVKHRFDRGTFAPLFWESLATGDDPVTLVVRFAATDAGLSIEAQVLDRLVGGKVFFTRTVQDTSAADPVASAPSPLQGTADSGPPWRGSGRVCLSLFGANEISGRLEMDVDNFGLRQVSVVTEADSAPLTYTHAPNQTLAYRLFAPPERQADVLYPLVLHLHGLEGVGDDNVRQFNRPGFMVFVSPKNQSKHPCFLVAPQISTKDLSAASGQYPYTWAAIRQKVTGLLTNLMTEFPIDPDRLYLTGASLGGIGAWSLATAYPELFAAAVPIAGMGDTVALRRITHLPVWAFHGARDRTIAVDSSRGLIAELRRLGAAPIYTEYTLASHLMFASAFATPGLVDWVMAQRRGTQVEGQSWITIASPAAAGAWPTSYTNLYLSGQASADAGITNVAWRNQTLSRSGNAEGTTEWAAVNIPLRAGVVIGTGIAAATNVVTIIATGTSWSALYGGTTTFNSTLRVAQIPVRLQMSLAAFEARLEWTGAAPAFVVQRCTDLGLADWADAATTGETRLLVPNPNPREFYRILLP